ncbi:DNA primase family protein [Pseudomarimonas arenosa]|uniref:SF3 helicase domain-containing protein n=1 Tax=Pseudomarimonas arenosa TaxID=2774145 RepID=A0AAW3ZHF1_9GAMM|nr:phage/plasmid primase, P4 family [Pseudomarimonas arenosa]MBD8524137.1 hypothetical protein [Pseudomarimonas arenosa]
MSDDERPGASAPTSLADTVAQAVTAALQKPAKTPKKGEGKTKNEPHVQEIFAQWLLNDSKQALVVEAPSVDPQTGESVSPQSGEPVLYQWNERAGIWCYRPRDQLTVQAAGWLRATNPAKATAANAEQCAKFGVLALQSEGRLLPTAPSGQTIIALDQGYLTVDEHGQGFRIQPPARDLGVIQRLSAAIDPDRIGRDGTYTPRSDDDIPESSAFKQYLWGAMPDPEVREVLREATASSLMVNARHERMFYLWGRGGNGKSIYVGLLQALHGNGFAALNLAQLAEDKFALEPLIRARCIVAAESDKQKWPTELIKSIVSGDPISVRMMHKTPITCAPRARVFIAMNEMPIQSDHTFGLARRIVLIPWTQTFGPGQRDSTLKDRLLNDPRELGYFLDWALEGVRRLVAKGDFRSDAELPAACTGIIQAHAKANDAVGQWIDSIDLTFQGGPSYWVEKQALYNHYVHHCQQSGMKVLAKGRWLADVQVRFAGGQPIMEKRVRFGQGRQMKRADAVAVRTSADWLRSESPFFPPHTWTRLTIGAPGEFDDAPAHFDNALLSDDESMSANVNALLDGIAQSSA